MDRLLRYMSWIWPWHIYKGTSTTMSDTQRSLQRLFLVKFNRRVNRTTAKFIMRSEYCIYELDSITTDARTGTIVYKLEHCATGTVISVDETTYQILFTHL